jgi:Fe-S-cluster-containing dehydrogenase component
MPQDKPKYGLLIDYEFCTGCFSCVVACKQEHDLPAGEWGIHVIEIGPETVAGKPIMYCLPFPTDNCNLCMHRVEKGLQPSCVKHCTAACMKFGTLDELVEEMRKKPKTVLYAPR